MQIRSMAWISRAAFATLTLGLLALAGCGSATPIKTLLDNPGSYEGKTVAISGNVTESVGALGYGAYRINDGTGTILVVTKTGGAPRDGAKIGVQGTFRSAFTVGTTTAAVIQETKRVSE